MTHQYRRAFLTGFAGTLVVALFVALAAGVALSGYVIGFATSGAAR